MADASKDGLVLGGGICCMTAISQFTHKSKKVPACMPDIV